MKGLKVTFLLILFALVLLPVLSLNTKADAVSDITNAKLTEWDREKFDPRRIDSYLEDRIGYYNESILTYMVLNDSLFGKMVHPNYSYGKDGYLFMKMREEVVDEEFLELFSRYLRFVQEICEKRGIPFVYCINPAKSTVYSELLPEGYHYRNNFLPIFYEKLDRYGVNFISNAELLRERAKTEAVYNRKYDAGHWNELGQFFGTNHLLEKVGEFFPEVKPFTLSDFTIMPITQQFLPVSRFRVDEKVPYFRYRDHVIRTTDDYSEVEIDKRHPHFQTYARADGGHGLPTALFFHGSYYNTTAEFYKGAFTEIYTVHNYQNLLRFEYYLDIFDPDIVLLETAEYATLARYFDVEEMRRQLDASQNETQNP